MPLEELAKFLTAKSRNRLSAPEDLAENTQKIARNSFRLTPNMADSINAILRMTMNNILYLQKSLKQVDTVVQTNMGAFQQPLESIPGFGPVVPFKKSF